MRPTPKQVSARKSHFRRQAAHKGQPVPEAFDAEGYPIGYFDGKAPAIEPSKVPTSFVAMTALTTKARGLLDQIDALSQEFISLFPAAKSAVVAQPTAMSVNESTPLHDLPVKDQLVAVVKKCGGTAHLDDFIKEMGVSIHSIRKYLYSSKIGHQVLTREADNDGASCWTVR